MPKIVLGDNPFFAISHLSPEKSAEYLRSKDLRKKAIDILKRSRGIGIDLFMVSSHAETPNLLAEAGYGGESRLPRICLVVPNVHQFNKTAAVNGVTGAISALFKRERFRLLSPRRLYQVYLMANTAYPEIEYVALHNVIVDMLLGLRAHWLLSAFCWLTRRVGYKPVLITLNPITLMQAEVKCAAICCYHNLRGYNMCSPTMDVLATFEAAGKVEELWAMGIVASGEVGYQELAADQLLKKFDRALIASSKYGRIKAMKEVLADA